MCNFGGLIPEPQTCKKSRSRDRCSQPHRHFWCHILVSWDLFFGQCHFWSLKTVDLATIFGKHNQNWQVLVFLPLLCFVLGLWCCICDKFYIANHAVLVPHFTPAKSRSCHKTLFLQVCPKSLHRIAITLITSVDQCTGIFVGLSLPNYFIIME